MFVNPNIFPISILIVLIYKIWETSRNKLPSASNFKSFSRLLEQFFLTVGQNNFGNKIPFHPLMASFQSNPYSLLLLRRGLDRSVHVTLFKRKAWILPIKSYMKFLMPHATTYTYYSVLSTMYTYKQVYRSSILYWPRILVLAASRPLYWAVFQLRTSWL